MSPLQIEKRLSKLEAEVAQLKRATLDTATPTRFCWEDITGIFADDPAKEEAMALGREYCQSSQEKSRHA